MADSLARGLGAVYLGIFVSASSGHQVKVYALQSPSVSPPDGHSGFPKKPLIYGRIKAKERE